MGVTSMTLDAQGPTKMCSAQIRMRKMGSVTDLRDCQCRAPLLLQDVEAYGAIGIDVGVVYFCLEVYLQQEPLKACSCDYCYSTMEDSLQRYYPAGLDVQ